MVTNKPKNKVIEEDVWIKSACYQCFNACGIKIHRVNGVVVKIEGDPDNPQSAGGTLCARGLAAIMQLYSPHRVRTPLKRTNPEKGIGVDPKWVEISWEEALDTAAQKLRKIREDDPRKLITISFDVDLLQQQMRWVFGNAFGTPNGWSGGSKFFCGNGVHPIGYLNLGTFSFDPDLKHCNYLIEVGSQSGFLTDANALIRAKKMADARMRGMKLVEVDPICTPAASKADEWIPIRPGTDAAFALGMINVLLNELGIYDAKFLKKYTNGPYLIGPDGHYLRDKATSKPLIWDAIAGKSKTYDSPDIEDFALEGSYEVDGASGKPAFQLLKEHVRKYTCEEVSTITTIPAETIRRIAKEFGEAARIGSTIVIDGKELPYRPACLHYLRAQGHKHAILTGLSLMFVNIIVGNLDMPGGILGSNSMMLPNDYCTKSFAPLEGPDGMLTANQGGVRYPGGFPPKAVTTPQTIALEELFPCAVYSEPMAHLVLKEPERFKFFPYKPEAMINCRSNLIRSTSNPREIEQWLKKLTFQLSIATEFFETTEFADIVLPDTDNLERTDLWANMMFEFIESSQGEWYVNFRQPTVEPPPGARHWFDVLFELGDRIGILSRMNRWFNALHGLTEPYKLDEDKKYTWEEILDIQAKAFFGPEHDLAWFKKHGYLKWPKKVEEQYPRSFIKPRIAIYLEHFSKAGEEVKKLADELGMPWWDVSDYQPIPDWKPCQTHEQKPPYDLFVINYKTPIFTFTYEGNNAWLNEIAEHHPSLYYILINSQTAKQKGIKDGDLMRLQSEMGAQVEGKAKVTECIHPEVLGIAGNCGGWAVGRPIAKGKGVHINQLFSTTVERLDMMSSTHDTCVKVKVSKIS